MPEGISQIPQIVGYLTELQTLEIRAKEKNKYKLVNLPDSFGRLQSLKHIKFYQSLGQQPKNIIKKLKQIPRLQKLHILYSPLTQLQGIHQLSQLTQLKAFQTNLEHFPNIFKLPNLKIINLSKNKITKMPAEIGHLSSLTILHLPQGIVQLPPEIGDLRNLQQLIAFDSNLSSLPKQIGNLKQLKRICIQDAKLTQLPTQLSTITSLTQLDLSWNNIKQLPNQIGNLPNLTKLYMYKNRLTKIPKSLSGLSKQAQINLQGNPLDTATIRILQQMRNSRFEKLVY